MARPLVDLSTLNLTENVIPEEELRASIPHDHEFRLIDGVCFLDLEENLVVGYKDWDANPWWARGHIPGRPILPGVLLIEGAAQVATILMKSMIPEWDAGFVGLAGVDHARFRGAVTPPARVYFVTTVGSHSRRIARFPAQAFVDNKLVCDMEVLGIPL